MLPALKSAMAENSWFAVTKNFVPMVVDATASPAELAVISKEALPIDAWAVERAIAQLVDASHPAVFVSRDAWFGDKLLVLPKTVTVTAPSSES